VHQLLVVVSVNIEPFQIHNLEHVVVLSIQILSINKNQTNLLLIISYLETRVGFKMNCVSHEACIDNFICTTYGCDCSVDRYWDGHDCGKIYKKK
jgi:hypothetical protein